MGDQVLAQQIFPVVVAVGSANNDVDVFASGELGRFGSVSQIDRSLVIELNQEDRAVYPKIKHALVLRAADPSKVRW